MRLLQEYDQIPGSEWKGRYFKAENQSPQGFAGPFNSLIQVSFHQILDNHLKENIANSPPGQTPDIIPYGFQDYHDDHAGIYGIKKSQVLRLMRYRQFIHICSGGNPNPQKSFSSPICEMLSQYVSSATVFKSHLKNMLTEVPLMDTISDTKVAINSLNLAMEQDGVYMSNRLVKYFTSC